MLDLLWDIIKWLRNGPRVKLTIRPNTIYKDGGIVSREKLKDDIEVMTPSCYYHVEVINRGNLPTTIKKITATITGFYPKDSNPSSIVSEAFTPHFGNKLPYVLKPGEIWSCRHDQEHMMQHSQILRASRIKFKLYVSHRNKPIIKEMTV